MVRISEIELIKLLMEDGREAYVKIAKHFGVSETAIRKRVRALIEKGVIKKFTIEVNPKKIGFEIQALIGIDTQPEHFISVLDELKSRNDVVHLYSASGDHMILIEMWFKNSEALSSFIQSMESREEITRVCPAIILEQLK